ncbi:halovibrin HvnC [Pseudomonas brassicacearum]|uniref:halovibrin HvnC n=1 Tax=Pseudomonas brassicacearum TaxID=930166 RepID=UPI00218229A2|nr:halovibrin HvnC [Pseudomonas brassicacearum]
MMCLSFQPMSKALRQLVLRSAGLLLIGLMVSCSQLATEPPEINRISGTEILDGPSTAAYLTTLYNRDFPNCHQSNSQPAFLCSGVTLRITTKDPDNFYKVWDPSPISLKSGGVSFSYLRTDVRFTRPGPDYHNGFILYPIFGAPPDKIDLDYLCAYPMDAWGWNRSLTEVCGPSQQYPVQSQLCWLAGVTTPQQWLAVWNLPGATPNLRQCGFDVRDERNAYAGPAFYHSLQAKKLLGPTGFNEHNEVIIKTWVPGHPNSFPIMAFFYIAGAPNQTQGLAEAQYNQRDFYNSTNPRILLPIIRLTPAASLSQGASFAYVATDQVVRP